MNPQDFNIQELKELAVSAPNNLDNLLALAKAFADNGLWPEAIVTYLQALALEDVDKAAIYNELGTLYEEVDNLILCEQSYLKALDLQPENGEALLNLGHFYKEQKRFTEAMLVLQRCARSTNLGNKDHREAMRMISEILNEHGDEVGSTQWIKITETMGILPAEMMAARLRSAGILAWSWQEGAGQAFGLSVGALGTGHVVVMKKDADTAREILAETNELEEDPDFEESYAASDPSSLSKAVLGATAVVFNPLGTGLAFLLARFSENSRDVQCPHCGTELELEENEEKQGWYVCEECGGTTEIE